MSTKIILVAPFIFFILWLIIKTIVGRTPTKHSINIVSSLVLMVYFFIVIGTGIFWVARQELPVFDWHYLPGYILLCFGIFHIILNWKVIVKYLLKSAPSLLKNESKKEFNWSIRIASRTLLYLFILSAVFYAGGKFFSKRIVIFSETKQEKRTADPSAIECRYIKGLENEVTIGEFYHRGSSYPAMEVLSGLTWETRPDVYKQYKDCKQIILPKVENKAGDVLESLYKWENGTNSYIPDSISLEDLSILLYNTQGISKTKKYGKEFYDFRTAPSAGALYPVDIYIVVNNVNSLLPGLYHFNIKNHSLELIKEGNFVEYLESSCDNKSLYQNAAVTFIFSATFGRTGYKYGDRSYRYVNMDAGHAAYNLVLSSTTLGYNPKVIARFDDNSLNNLFKLETEKEAVLFLVTIGKESNDITNASINTKFSLSPLDMLANEDVSYLDLIHTGTSLVFTKDQVKIERTPLLQNKWQSTEGQIKLIDPAKGIDLFSAIKTRRSIRNYTDSIINLNELSALCYAACGSGSSKDPFMKLTGELNYYIVVKNVSNVAPGVYKYNIKKKTMSLINPGDHSDKCYIACLHQDFCKEADAIFIKTIELNELEYPDGDRGLRYAYIRSGIAGEGLYLQATALGIGVCGVGAFYDDRVADIVNIDLDKELVLYITAIGK